MSGQKFDEEKAMMHLLDPYWTEDVARVMTFGAKKYAAENWRAGIEFTRIISSLRRHLLEIEKGQDIDPETNLPHAAHLACNSMFLHYYGRAKRERDDRFYAKPEPVAETKQEICRLTGIPIEESAEETENVNKLLSRSIWGKK